MVYVFLGNCQLQALRDMFRRFIGRTESITFEFVNAYEGVTPDSHEMLARANVVILQQGQRAPIIERRHIPQGVPIHLVPAVNGIFLWPFQGIQHPLKPKERYGNPPYPEEYNDQFLAKLIERRVPATEALAAYRAFDAATHGHVQRLYVHTQRTHKALDSSLGYQCADIIETYLQHEQIFQSPYHFGGRIGRHLAATLSRRLGFPETYARRIESDEADAPFLKRFLPIHPSVARHFGLQWVTDDTRYPFLYEGGYTFDEYVVRFMHATWSAALQEGVIDTYQGSPDAKSKLLAGLREAPRSGLGHHALSTILQREGDLPAALSHQRQAFALSREFVIAMRLGELLKLTGDIGAAADAFAEATRLDPFEPAAWRALSEAQAALGRKEEARRANLKTRALTARLM